MIPPLCQARVMQAAAFALGHVILSKREARVCLCVVDALCPVDVFCGEDKEKRGQVRLDFKLEKQLT
nr:hypothetical transcript [Hymenolepis microstoma]